jgi:hypothetical protein
MVLSRYPANPLWFSLFAAGRFGVWTRYGPLMWLHLPFDPKNGNHIVPESA